MKHKIYSILAGTLAFTLGACDDTWNPQVESEGTLQLSSMALEVNTAEKELTRASNINVDNFQVEIVDKTTNATKGSWLFGKMPEIVTLSAGEYTVNVTSHSVEKAAWDAPLYEGSKDFNIVNNKITNIGTVVCKFASLKVTIAFAQDLIDAMEPGFGVTVMVNDEGSLKFDVSTQSQAGYFEVIDKSVTMIATFTGKFKGNVNNEVTTIRSTYSDVAKGTYYNLTYSLKGMDVEVPEETGNVSAEASGITVNVEGIDVNNSDAHITINEETIESNNKKPESEPDINPDEGSEDPDDPAENVIKFESKNLDFINANNPKDTKFESANGGAIVTITADNGVQHLYVHIESDSDSFNASAAEMVPFDFDLSNPVIDGKDWSADFKSLGFPVGDEVIGKTQLQFDITTFVPLLAAFPGTHQFKITVVDAEENSKSVTLKFKAE